MRDGSLFCLIHVRYLLDNNFREFSSMICILCFGFLFLFVFSVVCSCDIYDNLLWMSCGHATEDTNRKRIFVILYFRKYIAGFAALSTRGSSILTIVKPHTLGQTFLTTNIKTIVFCLFSENVFVFKLHQKTIFGFKSLANWSPFRWKSTEKFIWLYCTTQHKREAASLTTLTAHSKKRKWHL